MENATRDGSAGVLDPGEVVLVPMTPVLLLRMADCMELTVWAWHGDLVGVVVGIDVSNDWMGPYIVHQPALLQRHSGVMTVGPYMGASEELEADGVMTMGPSVRPIGSEAPA